ncbi:transporter substrate-binding domain-containing protein [Rhodobacteraceae bacterium LMO-12]|nr:transporter substrate-binding domain-containing protein [Rhodobacteraceae bacterium LMO-JJ12]
MMRFTLPMLLLAAALALPGVAQAGDGQRVRIATEGAFPPYNSLDANGQPQGFEIDLGNAICAHTGWNCSWLVHDWTTLLSDLAEGEFDAAMAGISITPSRRAVTSFSREYFRSADKPQGLFVGTHTFQDPAHAMIAVQEGTIHEDHLKSMGYNFIAFPTAGGALKAVLDGTCDLTFGNPDFLESRVYSTSRMLAIIRLENIDAGGAAVAIAPGRSEIKQGFDAALDALEADGTIEKLRKKWFTKSTET